MSSYVEIIVIVEGQTEQRFIKQVLAPYMAERGVYLTAIILGKPGEKGGDVRFARASHDIGRLLKQRPRTMVTLLVDYYGIKGDWPGYRESKKQTDHRKKAQIMNKATSEKVKCLFPEEQLASRFIPYVSMHEIEALYFSDAARLAEALDVSQDLISSIVKKCGEPEKINENATTAPSKRLKELSERFKKTTTGIAIATAIGIPKMRSACPLFNAWLDKMETLVKSDNDET